MASLTQTAITTRKIVRYGIYAITFLIVARVVLGIAIPVIQKLFPAPPPPPTIQFGKLPPLPFPSKKDVPSTISYTIQTPENGLPNFPTQANVYFMPQPKPDLLALDNAKKKASNIGFASAPNQVSQTIYGFTNQTNLSTVEINIITGTFSLGFNLNADPSPLDFEPPTPEAAAAKAKNFLSQAQSLPDDLTGPVTQEYLKVQNKQLIGAISLSEASLTKINLFRKDYNKLPSVTPNPGQANVWFILSGSQDQGKQIIGAQYYYYPVDETQYATYPIKTSEAALNDLKAGKGYIANIGDNKEGKIIIRRVFLAYYDAGVAAQFYQPVIVFEGDNGFSAYVPAVTSTYYSE